MEFLFCFAAVLALACGEVSPDIDNAKIDHDDCGRRSSLFHHKPDQIIVGGAPAEPYSWPWMCSLRLGGRHICGGQLIKSKEGRYFFLTAAHCVGETNFNAGRYKVSCGIYYHADVTDTQFRQDLSLKQLLIHPQYNSNTLRNDIAIMSLFHNPDESPAIGAVCIAQTHYETVDTLGPREDCVVTGWGTLSSGGSSPPMLHEVHKPIVSDRTCSDAYGNTFHPATMMCAGDYGNGGVDACQGDSGGPLVVFREGIWKLVGIVSWGYGCADPRYPGVYTDVFHMKSWIAHAMDHALP